MTPVTLRWTRRNVTLTLGRVEMNMHVFAVGWHWDFGQQENRAGSCRLVSYAVGPFVYARWTGPATRGSL